ncbi:hypothetical protein D3C85_501260 [compost metagenome]
MALGFGVECRGGFVEDQQRRIFQQRPGDRQTLTLATGQQHAIFTDLRIQAFGHLRNEVHCERIRSGLFNVGTGCTGQVTVSDVVGDGVVEQGDMLRDLGHVPTQVAQAVVFDLDIIEQDFADVVMIETRNQAGQGRLAAA